MFACCRCSAEQSINSGGYMCGHTGECPKCPGHQLADQATKIQSEFFRLQSQIQPPIYHISGLGAQAELNLAPILTRLDLIEKLLAELIAEKAAK